MGAEGENVVEAADVRGFHEKSAAPARVMSGRSLPVLPRLEERALPTVAAVQGCLPGPGPTHLDTLLADRTVRAAADLHGHLGVLPAAIDTHGQALSA
ncbi:hypothetical protein [Streptomyces sp. NPDC048411]|uniref:hypothetical protein n=1 Tax=Streptomyces sp. NPDC048411 TaxID=3157206 RepID=UPI0034541698